MTISQSRNAVLAVPTIASGMIVFLAALIFGPAERQAEAQFIQEGTRFRHECFASYPSLRCEDCPDLLNNCTNVMPEHMINGSCHSHYGAYINNVTCAIGWFDCGMEITCDDERVPLWGTQCWAINPVCYNNP